MNLRILRTAFGTATRRALREPGSFFVATGFYVAVVAMVGTLWRVAAASHHGTLAGYTAVGLFWYIAASESATMAISLRLVEEIGDDIVSGAIAVEMLRPVSVVAVRIAAEFGRAVPKLISCILAGTAVSLVVVGPPRNVGAALLSAISLVLAILCNIAAQHAFAGIAFWIRDARSTWFLYQKFVFVLGGMLLPIQILPTALEQIARALPFTAMAYAPARLAAGFFEPELLLVQSAWLVVLIGVAAATFQAGERRLQVVGG